MKTILKFDTHNALVLPPMFQHNDVRFSDSFAEFFIEQFSKPGDVVFDPFAGFGTALYAAERLGRRAFGVEFLPERVAFIKENMREPDSIVCGSSLALADLELPEIDFIVTSPPYMQKTNHPEYPFAGYKITGQGYEDYLRDVANIFKQLKKKMKPGAHAVIEVGNLSIDGAFTPLAWDIARSIGAVLTLKQEIVVEWQSETSPAYGFGYDHSYALVFQNGGAA
jgi:DNA modification methylase